MSFSLYSERTGFGELTKKKYLIAARVDVVCLIFNCECEIVVNEVVEEVMHELRS